MWEHPLLTDQNSYAYALPITLSDGVRVGYVLVLSTAETWNTLMNTTVRSVTVAALWIFLAALIAIYFITERTVAMAKKYGKQSERWIMGYNKRPADFGQIDKVVDMYEELGVDRLATWTYRGGYGTVVAAKDALELWDNIGRNYRRVLKK